MPWELTRPLGLALLGLIVPLVALYVLKIRRERRVVPSVWLWQAAERDLRARSPFRKLLPSVPLLLELLALAALALALAGPVVRSKRLPGDRLVLVVDVSASMSAVESGASRVSRALALSRDAVRRLSPGVEMMVLAAGREPELLSPFERDRVRLEAAVARISAHEAEGHLGPAVAMAADQLRQRGGGRILLVTDGAVSDADALVDPGIPVDVVRVDAGEENTAIVRAEVSRAPDPVTGRDQVQVFALIVHHGPRAREVFVTLAQRNAVEPLTSRRVRLEPGERAPLVLAFDAAPGDAGAGLTLELSPKDALASDDRAHVRVPLGRKLPVVLAPKKASAWLSRALETDPELELFRAELDALNASSVPDDALVVVDGACPASLPGADVLIVNPGEGPCRTATVGSRVEDPAITSWAETDPRLRFLTFDDVRIAGARKVVPERAADALLRARDATLVADVSSPGRTGTLVGFDVGESTWPLKASFVLFMRNVVELARVHRAGSAQAPARPGEPISIRVPLDVGEVELEGPSGERARATARSGLAVVTAPTRVGFVHVSWKGARPGSTLVPVSLSSEAESRIAARPLPFTRSRAGSPATALDAVSDLGWLLALAALALIALDVAWVTRARRSPPSRASSASGVAP